MTSATKPLPRITPLTRPFWEGCQAGELRLQRCSACGNFRFFPAEGCPACGSGTSEWTRVDGLGRVYTWIVVHRAIDDAWAGDVPFAIVVAELDLPGRPLLTGTLTGADPATLRAGMPLRAEFDAVNDEVSLLRWRPIGEDA